MPVNFVAYSGKSNIGWKMKVNEDYILFNDYSFGDDMMFASIADGSGSKDDLFRPSGIVSNMVLQTLARAYKKRPDLLKENTKFFLEEAFLAANNILIGFKLGNEEERYGYATTLSACLLERSGKFSYAHVGNTRIYMIRDGVTHQLTKDQTEGQKLVDSGVISQENYYTAMERLSLYNGIGVSSEPFIQTGALTLRKNDLIIMTTDGIHYAYRDEAFFNIMMETETVDEAAERMVKEALDLKVFADNISVNILWYLGEEGFTPVQSQEDEEEDDDDYYEESGTDEDEV